MLQGQSSVLQALLGTLFTWGLTAAGAALVFVFSSGQRRILDGSLGFAAGVMLAASYWSLLAPAVEMATSSGGFGAFAFFPVAIGFTLGAAFVYLADLLMPHLGATEDPPTALALNFAPASMKKSDTEGPRLLFPESELSIRIGRAGLISDKSENGEAYQRKKAVATSLAEGPASPVPPRGNPAQPGSSSWRRITLLILAITIHNIPEGLAVGVGFGAVGKTASATFESARWNQRCEADLGRCSEPRKKDKKEGITSLLMSSEDRTIVLGTASLRPCGKNLLIVCCIPGNRQGVHQCNRVPVFPGLSKGDIVCTASVYFP
ncbi:zinc transporter ZIP11 isoform X3 [Mirounga leonina]|uniref:zinc transporter ZIP11 isoform X3 n=1 Tax=Mirounga leonina TaxID=9715 RepID=UPI00156BE9D6|nr:zinc transporter ZIP11 isoform X3 [Mirounga leonina]